jgi:hypothetical protein
LQAQTDLEFIKAKAANQTHAVRLCSMALMPGGLKLVLAIAEKPDDIN